MNAWRLLGLKTHEAFMNMAIDEAILIDKVEDLTSNTLRLYRWKPSAVSVGKFQQVQNEVQIENCSRQGVDVVRRITGGGTVYHAENEITYSVVASKEDLRAGDIAEVYARICSGLTEAFRMIGVTADFDEGSAHTCPNLTVKGKKISGSAQCHRRGVVLQHGTILAKANLEEMFTYLRVPWAENCTQVLDVARRKITSLHDELGKDVSTEGISQALVHGFRKALGIRLIKGKLTSHERELAETLYRRKYATDEWNLQGRSSI